MRLAEAGGRRTKNPGLTAVEFTRFSLVVTAPGLDFRSAWRPACFVAWQDIHHVSFNMLLKCFVIRSSHARPIRVSTMIAGISDFAGELEKRLDPAVLKKAKHGFIEVGRPFPGDGIFG